MKIRHIFFALAPLLVLLVSLEGAFRIYYSLEDTRQARGRSFSTSIGWETDPNVQALYRRPGNAGVSHYSTQAHGFRVFGDPHSRLKKVLVLGDSFTEAKYIGDGLAYYDFLRKNNPGIEIFAYGSAGFGSMQEYMILDRYFDLIQPDLVLWQFSGNDIINNDHELESLSLINNNHMTRPYDEDGTVRMRYPEQIPPWMYGLMNRSYLIRFLKVKMGFLKSKMSSSTIEKSISEKDPRFQRSIETTVRILKKVKARTAGKPVVTFNSNQGNYIHDPVFEDIAGKAGVYFVPGVDEAVHRARKQGMRTVVSEADDHWTEAGHAVAGRRILQVLEEKNLV